MIRVLHVLPALSGGGIESMLYNYYKFMDKKKIHFDFAIHDNKNGIIGERLIEEGCKIFYITPKSKSLKQCIKDFDFVFKNNKYDVIHVHQSFMSFIALRSAKKNGVKYRICHSHNSIVSEDNMVKFKNKILRIANIYYGTEYFACGKQAAEWLYGTKMVSEGKVNIINNAIEINKYKFNKEMRMILRKKYNIEDQLTVGFVGRFSEQKNVLYIIEIFKEIVKIKSNSILVLIGDGELKTKIEDKIKEYNLSNNVIFTGMRNDVNILLNMLDVLLLPSYYEGFPVILIEAQVAGLKCLVSNLVSEETNITKNNLIEFLDINNEAKRWAECVCTINTKRKECIDEIIRAGYSIESESEKLQKKYINLVEIKNE